MDVRIDLRVAELLASRLCHDLVSPIGAVNNGMELLEEDPDPDLLGDAVALASGSARQAAAVVQFYRLAYGRAGQQVDSDAVQLCRLASDYLHAHKAEFAWPDARIEPAMPDGTGKLLLNMVALAVEALPRGGEVRVAACNPERGLEVVAEGTGAQVRAESLRALSAEESFDIEALTPRSVQAYFAGVLARRAGGRLTAEGPSGEPARVVLRAAPMGGG